MAESKKQHYVPQFYLRNFSKDGKTIGCAYLEAEKPTVIEAAPIRSQAAEDYFYTNKTQLETAFSKIEGEAREIIYKIVISDNVSIDCAAEDFLKQYILFQHVRTPYLANHFESEINKMFNCINGTEDGKQRVQLNGKQVFVLNAVLPEVHKTAKRFHLIVLDNQTEMPFITSPEPAVFFNPYQKKRKRFMGGVETYGGMFFLPLSAKKAIILYDRKAYKVKEKETVSCSLSDVCNLNAQIFITMNLSNTNVFYYDNSHSKDEVFAALLQMNNYIGDYPVLDFIREKYRLFDI